MAVLGDDNKFNSGTSDQMIILTNNNGWDSVGLCQLLGLLGDIDNGTGEIAATYKYKVWDNNNGGGVQKELLLSKMLSPNGLGFLYCIRTGRCGWNISLLRVRLNTLTLLICFFLSFLPIF